MMRLWLSLIVGVILSSMGMAGGPADKSKTQWIGKCVMPREGAKVWMGGHETTQSLPLSLDVMAEDGDWLFISGGRIKKSDVVSAEEAVSYYQSLLKANPQNSWAMAMLAWHHVSEDEHDQARALLDKALQLDHKNVDAWLARGTLYGLEEEYESAIKQFDEAIRIRPDSAHALYVRGLYRSESGDEEGALADYGAAINVCPEYSYAYTGRGAVYDESERWKEALADFDKSLSLDPYDNVALVRRARIRATCPDATYRDSKLAIMDAEKACELSKFQDWEDLEVLAAAYAEAGRFADAVTTQTKVVELAQGGRRFLMRLQLTRYQQNKPYKFPPTEEQP